MRGVYLFLENHEALAQGQQRVVWRIIGLIFNIILACMGVCIQVRFQLQVLKQRSAVELHFLCFDLISLSQDRSLRSGTFRLVHNSKSTPFRRHFLFAHKGFFYYMLISFAVPQNLC